LRRKEEVEALITQNREEEVYFTGFLTHNAAGEWRIDDIQVIVPHHMTHQVETLESRYVFLHADLSPLGELVVEWIEPRVYIVTGRISNMEPQRLQVGDIWLQLDEFSQVPSSLAIGQTVRASITRMQGETLIALKIEAVGPVPTPSRTVPPVIEPSQTPQPENNGEEARPTEKETSSDHEKKGESDEDEHNDEKDGEKDYKESTKRTDDDKKSDSDQEKPTPTPTPRRRR